MTRRFTYPFIPEISRQLHTSTLSIQNAVAVQAGVGLASPLFGGVTEHYGRKRIMLVGLTLMAIGSMTGILFTSLGFFYAIMITFGFAKILYDPAMQAYISDRVAYKQRALAIGTTELAWAGSLMIVAPLAGFILGRWGLSEVFGMLLGLSLISIVLVWRFLPNDKPTDAEHQINLSRRQPSWQVLKASPIAIASLTFTLLLVLANESLLIVYGIWMEEKFGLALEALGSATIVIAAAEVLGEFSVIGIADRFGIRRLALFGVCLSSCAYLVLPALEFSLTAALIGLFVLFFWIEIAIVSSISLMTEVLPHARAVMMSSNVAAHSIGRFAGAIVGGLIFSLGGFQLTGITSFGIGLAACVILWRFIPDFNHPE